MSGEENLSVSELNGAPERVEPQIERPDPVREEPAKREPVDPPKPTGPYQNKRAALFEKAKAQRDAEEAENGIRALPDDVERNRVPPGTETFADREARRAAAQGQQDEPPAARPPEARQEQAPEPPPTRRVKVNGREMNLTEDQLIAAAQVGLASESALEDAKRLRAQLQQKIAELETSGANHSPEGQRTAAPSNARSEDTKPDAAELDEIIDALQVGDKNEAAKALEAYANRVKSNVLSEIGDIDRRISSVMQERDAEGRVLAEAAEVANSFIAQNEVFRDPAAERILMDRTYTEMGNALRDAGVPSQVVTGIMNQQGISLGEAISFTYRKALVHGIQVPKYDEILKRASSGLQGILRQSSPTPPKAGPTPEFVAARDQRKAAIQTQPRRASVVPGAEAGERSEDDKRRDWILQQKMLRTGKRR